MTSHYNTVLGKRVVQNHTSIIITTIMTYFYKFINVYNVNLFFSHILCTETVLWSLTKLVLSIQWKYLIWVPQNPTTSDSIHVVLDPRLIYVEATYWNDFFLIFTLLLTGMEVRQNIFNHLKESTHYLEKYLYIFFNSCILFVIENWGTGSFWGYNLKIKKWGAQETLQWLFFLTINRNRFTG